MAKREVVRKQRFTNPLLLESLNRIEQTGYSQPRNPNNRNLNSEIGSNVYLSPSESLLLSPKYNPSNNFNNSLLSSKINPDLSIPLERPEIINNLGLMSASTMPAANLITPDKAEETKKQIDNLIAAEGTDLNKHTGLGNMLARLGGAQIATEEERAAATPELRELYNQQRLAARNKGIGQMLFALSDALGGRDVASRSLERQQFLQSQVEADRDRQSQLETQQALSKYLSPEEMALYAAGVSFKDIKEFTTEDLSGQDIIQNVEKNVEQTINQTDITDSFANINQAFGPVDAAQEALSKATRFIGGFEVDPLGSGTGAAVRARNSLNTEILANLAADFTGRPNLLIYENLKGNLPMNAATSEKDAKEKYINVKNQVDARINNLKQGVLSSNLSDSDKEKYREELNKSLLLSKKLDSAILSLKGETKDILEPDSNSGSVDFSNLYLE